MDQVTRYHPLLVTLHWVLALLIAAAFFLGLWLAATANTTPRTFIAHAALAAILASLIVLHLIIASWHQFIRRDGLLGRMSFGRRRVEQP